MKKYYSIVLLILLFGCDKNTCFEKSGQVVTANRTIASTGTVYVYDNINLVLTQDNEDRLTIEAHKNLHDFITAEMAGDALTLRNTSSCSWMKSPSEKITAYLSVKGLNKIVYEGSGIVSSTNTLQADHFTIDSDGGAGVVAISLNAKLTRVVLPREGPDISLQGASDSCYTYCTSRGTINFKNFVVKKMQIDYGSVRNAFINVTESLRGRIYHTGNVYYSGNPGFIQMEKLSSGKLLRQ